MQLSNI